MKCVKKICWNHFGICLGPRIGAEREARSGGRSGGLRAQPDANVLSAFFCRTSWIPWFEDLLPKVFVNTTKIVQKINEYQVTKIKKYAGFLLKSNIGEVWTKNTARDVYYRRVLTVLKKSKLRLYNSVVLKDVKKVVFYDFINKKSF